MPRGIPKAGYRKPRQSRKPAPVPAAVAGDEAAMQASIARLMERTQAGQVGYAALPDVPAGAEAPKPPLMFPGEGNGRMAQPALPDLQGRVAVSQALGYAATFQAQLDSLGNALAPGDPRQSIEAAASLMGTVYNRLAAAAGLLAPRAR